MEKIIKIEHEIKEIYCDFCKNLNKINSIYLLSWKCEICGKDCCHKHLIIINESGEDYADHKYCMPCYKIMKPILEEITEMEAETDMKSMEMLNDGQDKALAQYKKNKK